MKKRNKKINSKKRNKKINSKKRNKKTNSKRNKKIGGTLCDYEKDKITHVAIFIITGYYLNKLLILKDVLLNNISHSKWGIPNGNIIDNDKLNLNENRITNRDQIHTNAIKRILLEQTGLNLDKINYKMKKFILHNEKYSNIDNNYTATKYFVVYTPLLHNFFINVNKTIKFTNSKIINISKILSKESRFYTNNILERGLIYGIKKKKILTTKFPKTMLDLIYNSILSKINDKTKYKSKKLIYNILKVIVIINLIYNNKLNIN